MVDFIFSLLFYAESIFLLPFFYESLLIIYAIVVCMFIVLLFRRIT